jgi:hypothetical protein
VFSDGELFDDEVAFDDALLNVIGTGFSIGFDGLSRLLSGWRAEIVSSPMVELVSVDDAMTVIIAARERLGYG